ncbi:MAG TPA: hypothetical protein VJ548_03710 [Azospira sp.]|nr:hypothetical protein [Azospira sp.]
MKASLLAAVLSSLATLSTPAFAASDPGDLGDDNHDFIVASSPDSFVCQGESGRHVLSSVPCDQREQRHQEGAAKTSPESHHDAAEPHPPVTVTGPSANDSLY